MLNDRKHGWMALALIIVVLSISFSLLVPSYGEICTKNEYSGTKECDSHHIALVLFWQFIKWANDFGPAITALATVAVAGFTWTLYRATSQQGRLTGQAIDLTRAEFNVTHRPKIILRAFVIGDRDLQSDRPVGFIFTAHNIGDSPGRVIEVRSATLVLKDKEKIPDDLSFPFSEKFSVSLKSGQREIFPANGGSAVSREESMQIFAGSHVLLCLGSVIYLDAEGTRRETGFCRRYRPRQDEWDTIKESPYEYAY